MQLLGLSEAPRLDVASASSTAVGMSSQPKSALAPKIERVPAEALTETFGRSSCRSVFRRSAAPELVSDDNAYRILGGEMPFSYREASGAELNRVVSVPKSA